MLKSRAKRCVIEIHEYLRDNNSSLSIRRKPPSDEVARGGRERREGGQRRRISLRITKYVPQYIIRSRTRPLGPTGTGIIVRDKLIFRLRRGKLEIGRRAARR